MAKGVARFIKENFERYGKEELRSECCRKTGATSRQFSKTYKWIAEKMARPPERQYGLTEADLRAKHDVSFIIQDAVNSLEDGIYLNDNEFIHKFLRGQTGYRQAMDKFKDYRGRASGITYWSSKKSIYKMKMEGVLS
jgi:hypothetical protein